MKHFVTFAAAASLACTAVAARPAAAAEPFRWAPKSTSAAQQWRGLDKALAGKAAVVTKGDHSFAPGENVSYLDMPDGSTWFVVADFRKTVVEESEYYTDYDITGLTATVYNDRYEVVGRIDSDLPRPEGFEKCTNVQIAPCVSKKFFNTDDKYEIMVMANYKPVDDYGAVPFTTVFSLQGANTPAKTVTTLPGYYVVAVNNPRDEWSEDFFMEFFVGERYTDTEMLYTFKVYSKASYGNPGATEIGSFEVDMVHVMSDGDNESMPVLINSRGGEVYATVSRYEKTFFANPFDPTDETISPDNHYLIDLYRKGTRDSALTLQSTTSLAVQPAAEGRFMRSYCLGQFQGYTDLSFDFTDDGTPAFVVSEVETDNMENSYPMFNVYSTDGTVLATFGTDHAGFLQMSDVPGASRQYCFLMPDADTDGYVFAFVDYPSMERRATLPVVYIDGNNQLPLSLNIDRVAVGGGYGYAAASQKGAMDDKGNTYHEVAWFDADCILTGIDRLNAGQNINLINPYISADGLGRYLFNTDSAREYMMFVQRANSDDDVQSHTELCVVNDREEMLMQYAFKTYDSGVTAALVNLDTNPALWIIYRDGETDAVVSEFVSLPLNKFEGEGTAQSPYIIRTPGDFALVGKNLASHYRLGCDIDFGGEALRPIAGTFTGSLDGAGHTVSNFSLNGGAIFEYTGDENPVTISDITFSGVNVSNAPAVLVDRAYATTFSGVVLRKVTVAGDYEDQFGTLASYLTGPSAVTRCYVQADIDLPQAEYVGGVVSTTSSGSRIDATAFRGSISASATVGGIAASVGSGTAVADCHVVADLKAGFNVGGIAGISNRGPIERCVVEGTVEGTTPRLDWETETLSINVGGIVGNLKSADVEYDDNGNPVAPSAEPVLKGNIAALDAITVPAEDGIAATAHRIVGRSRVNDGPEYLGEEYDETTDDWTTIWGDPAKPEANLADNHALDTLAPVDDSVAVEATSTEGATVEYDALDDTFLAARGFDLEAGTWVLTGWSNIPELAFEASAAQYMAFQPASITIGVGETARVVLVLDGVTIDELTMKASDDDHFMANPVELTDEGNAIIEISADREGSYTLEASSGVVTARLVVEVKAAGVTDAVTSARIAYDGRTLRAPGRVITVYSVTGAAMASGADAVSVEALTPGIYAARAAGLPALKFRR